MCKTFHDGCRALIIHLLFRFPVQKGTEPEIAQFPISLWRRRRRRRRRRRNGKDSLSFPASKGLKWGPPSLAWPPTSRDPWIHNNEQMKQSFEATRHHCGGQSDMTDFLTRLSDKTSERKFMSFTSTKAVLRTLWWKFWKKEKLNYIKCPMY